MLLNYLTIAVRNFLRHPIYSAINISGLVLGLACSILILLWVEDELRYDRYHPDNDRVFRIMENEPQEGGFVTTEQWVPVELTEIVRTDFPEIESLSRRAWSEDKLFRFGDKANYEYGIYADQPIFDVLNINLIQGSRSKPLPDNNSVAISKSMAERYFKGHALGQTFLVNNALDLKVTAVFEDNPSASSETFDFVLPVAQYIRDGGGYVAAFLKLRSRDMRAQVDEKLVSLWRTHRPEEKVERPAFLFPMTEWRLYGHFENGKQVGGRISYVISFSVVALFILAIACINFMNLSTARAANRSREVGIRKVAGASRHMLWRQFMAESVALSFLSLAGALLLVHMLLPAFNSFTQKSVAIHYDNPYTIGALLGITLLTGLLAGSYPSFFLSSFKPASVLKGNLQSVFAGAGLRRGLVVFQFALSVVIIVSALVVNDQIEFMRNKNLGFDQSHVFSIKTNADILKNYHAFRTEALQNPAITSVGLGAANPMEVNGQAWFEWEGRAKDDLTYFNEASCDYDYLETLGFTFVEGRNFSRDFPSDIDGFVVTEEAVRIMGFDDPIGKKLSDSEKSGPIIGVIKDFHNLDIHEAWHPTVFYMAKTDKEYGWWAEIFVRYEPGRLQEALDHAQKTFSKVNPQYPIMYSFLDQVFDRQFRTESVVGTLSLAFTTLAIVISCLGLFGLSLFNTERRVKEIGIRKVLGASISGLVVMLCRDFVKLVAYAIILGSPLAFYLMEQYLQTYPYRTTLQWAMFVIPAVSMLVISLGIISWQSVRAAVANPVEALRAE